MQQLHRISAGLLAVCVATFASAGEYRISPGPLETALLAFSRQGNAQLFFAPTLVAGKQSPGLTIDDASQAHALATLLRGSGLRADQVADDAFVLRAIRSTQSARQPSSIKPLPPLPLDAVIPTELGHVQVFGLLPRTEIETSQPVTVIDRQDIEYSGYQTLYELLRAQPGIRVDNAPVATGDSQTYLNNGLSGATGAASVSLHGLGATATPVLIDGQRLVGYGLAQGQFGTATDLNSIPLALIDRVEILRDGASVLYGADAMAGALNIVLRKQFEGAEISAMTGTSFHGDAAQQRVSGTFGSALPGAGHMLLSFDYLNRQPLLNRQRRWTRNTNQADDEDDYFFVNGAGFGYAGELCRVFRPTDACQADPDGQTTLQTSLRSRSLLLHVDRPVGALSLYGDLRWTSLRQSQQSPPWTGNFGYGYDDAGRFETYSFDDVGPVVDRTDSRTLQLTLGLNGKVGAWNWDLRLDGQSNAVDDRIHGLIRESVLDGDNYQFGSDDNSPALLAALSPTLLRHGLATRSGFTGRVDGVLGNTHQGDITLTAGLEAYRESLVDRPDPLLLTSDIYQIQPPSVRSNDRWDTATYAEVKAPLLPRLTADAGVRIEHSDGYHGSASPRMGLKWNISDMLSLRGSWALGYRAPPLMSLVQSPSVTGSQEYLAVPSYLLPCQSGVDYGDGSATCILRLESAGNPHLQPERSHSLGVGIVFAPTTRLGMTLDAYQLDRYREIGAIPLDYGVQQPEAFPQLFLRDANGVLYAFEQQAVNLGRARLRTVDLDMRYQLPTARYGEFTFELGVNWLAQLKRRLVGDDTWLSYAGYANQPRVTALASLDWRYRDWLLTTNLRYTGHYAYAPYAPYAAYTDGAFRCSYQNPANHCETPAFTLVDVDVSYAGWPRWTFGVNVHNLFDHRPVFYGDTNLDYSPTFDDIVGRYLQFSVHYRF
jgi:iron complex outermembrane receptor protein